MRWFTNSSLSPTLLRFVLWQAEKRKRPLIASINVVNRCNLHCAGCYWTKRREREEECVELSIEEGVELIHVSGKEEYANFSLLVVSQ